MINKFKGPSKNKKNVCKKSYIQCCGSENIFFRIRFYPEFRIRIVYEKKQKTFELQNCRSSKHRKKADFFKSVHFWIRIVDGKYIWNAENLNRKKTNFSKSVHFYSFVCVSWKQNLTWIRILCCKLFRIRIHNPDFICGEICSNQGLLIVITSRHASLARQSR